MLTGEQIRAARAMLRMEQATLAEKAGISIDSIKRAEGVDGEPKAQLSTLSAMRRVFELHGLDLEGGGVRRAADRNERMITAIVSEVESIARSGLEIEVRRDPEFFDRSIQHVTDRLAVSLSPELLKIMVERVMPKERG